MEEEANLIYTDLKVGEYQESKDKVSIVKIVNELQKKGYKIKTITPAEKVITGITINPVTISVLKGGTATIEVTYEGSMGPNIYYVIIEGKYYLMTETNHKIVIAREETKNIEEETKTEQLKAVSSNEECATVTIEEGNEILTVTGVTPGSATITVTYGSYTKECSITIEEPPVDAATIKSKANDFYGKLVENYNVRFNDDQTNGDHWRIFYADDSNIYLVADDFANYKYMPNGKNGAALSGEGLPYSVHSGLSVARSNYNSMGDMGTKIFNKWFPKGTDLGNSDTGKCMALLFDTSIWTPALGDDKFAEYVVGTVSTEVYCMSYKDTHPQRYVMCGAPPVSSMYYVKWSDDNDVYTNCLRHDNMLQNEYNGIYVKTGAKATNWWLGPAGVGPGDCMMYVTNAGNFHYDYRFNTNNAGVRPVVCLKSGVQLKKQANGNYRIITD